MSKNIVKQWGSNVEIRYPDIKPGAHIVEFEKGALYLAMFTTNGKRTFLSRINHNSDDKDAPGIITYLKPDLDWEVTKDTGEVTNVYINTNFSTLDEWIKKIYSDRCSCRVWSLEATKAYRHESKERLTKTLAGIKDDVGENWREEVAEIMKEMD